MEGDGSKFESDLWIRDRIKAVDHPREHRGPLMWLAARTRAFWVGFALGLPVMYFISFGVACWFVTRLGSGHTVSRIYFPIGWTMLNSPAVVRRPLNSYVHFWKRSGRLVVVPAEPTGPGAVGVYD